MVPAVQLESAHRQRGIALVSALLVLLLVSVLAVSYMAVTVSERSVSSNVHVAKGSLYAADAGVRTAQQAIANLGRAKMDSLVVVHAANGGVGPIITQPDQLFPAGAIPVSASTPRFAAAATITFQDSLIAANSQTFDYRYTITSTGQLGVEGVRQVMSSGVLRLSATRGTFADYLVFTNIHTRPDGSLVWFTSTTNFDGRVHTNGEFRFTNSPTFGDLVSSVNTKAWYYNNGSPVELADNKNGSTDVPNFYGGFERGAQSLALPADAYSQQYAALGLPASGSPPSNTQINSALGTGAGNGTPPNGMYVPESGGAVAGGLYVQGDLNDCLFTLDGSGRQVYQMTQATSTKTITIDRTANQTIVQDGVTTVTLSGVPTGVLYVQGQVTSLKGPARVGGTPQPALADGTQLLLTATGDIILENDVVYQNYNAASSVLGLFSSAGDVRVGGYAPNNMQLDAFVMATGSLGAFAVDNYNTGPTRGTFHLRGGMVSTYYGAFGTTSGGGNPNHGFVRDFHYDRRGLIPPYFPSNPQFATNLPTARSLEWREL